ncbi:hypothetical protein [Microbacterium sp. YY-01]|uniref:hypothetical protein n=1 Tax=Microbacterium sp. YY-01 TaxID=3421634 RepID=UPI003D16A099
MTPRPLEPLIDESEEWSAVHWWRLELRSLDEAENTQFTLAQLGPKEAWSTEWGGRPTGASCLRTLSYVVSLTAPAVAAFAMGRAQAFGDHLPFALAGILVLISLIVTLQGEWSLYRRPRSIAASVVRKIAIVHIVPAVVVVVVGLMGEHQHPGQLLWLLPSVVDALVHVWQLFRRPGGQDGPRNPLDNLTLSVAEIAPEVAERIVQRRNVAIRMLHERGRIDADTAERAIATGLGHLALVMAPEACSNFYPPSAWERQPQ